MTSSIANTAPAAQMDRRERLHTEDGAIDFVGRRKLWYSITLGLLVVAVVAMLARGFNLGIDFEGGTKMSMPAGDLVAEEVEDTFVDATGVTPELTQIVGAGDARTLEINSEHLSQEQIDQARQAIFEQYQPKDEKGDVTANAIGDSTVSESWGDTITQRMLLAMLVFVIAAAVYVAVRLQREMALAALAALVVDAVLIMGFYALFGLEVTPAMIIGLLTVLTFSLYDTVIVFDKVKENTSGILDSRRSTYAEQANLAINQTVMRSISTTVISALPIIALMIVAVWMLGVGTLRDLALIQLIGVIEGVFSSLFLATSLLVTFIERRKKFREHNAAVQAFRNGDTAEHGEGVEGTEGAEGLGGTVAEHGKRTVGSISQRTSGAGEATGKGTGAESFGDTPGGAATWRPGR
ncbi:protein translocase subunit SecF [Corynebacterium godavarianum]|uniref:Protein-export membrane protein SecF n=1 Tax=Corynebacterium godavarianum TaxID=2054421 RepID=A0ABY3E865_9CORY|nr:protein translocase subunit SecF [Corynebacterium godavarianum]MBL7286038.1 protein translocase subunit SecF [Corynebacterium godavarianum]TSJ76189.1 protein translocase subunit SecF [Corynebacterium godavarianum]